MVRALELMGEGLPTATSAGDTGVANLMRVGQPERSRRALADLKRRRPLIDESIRTNVL